MYISVWISVATFFFFFFVFISLLYGSCVMSSPDPNHFLLSPLSLFYLFIYFFDVLQEYSRNFFRFQPLILYVVPSFAWGEDGIDELHVVGYVYQELLVCTANFTYMQRVCLHYTVCVCCIHIYNILNKNIYIKVYCNVSNILNAI